jgi:hypothetical protein
MRHRCLIACLLGVGLLTTGAPTRGGDYTSNPDAYLQVVSSLAPGDSLTLEPGVYRQGLPLHGLHGTPQRRIVVQGSRTGPPAILLGHDGQNTVSLADASYITVRDLRIDGLHLPVDGVKAEGRKPSVHHVTLERLTIVNHDFAQDIIAISTKSPAWGWVIRDNTIIGAGTGMYLGNSDGTAPFFDGVIENNLIIDTIGYNIEIKQQIERPLLQDVPVTPTVTVLRHNVFTNSLNASVGEAARPNVLVGHFPLRGPGRDDRYEIVGNIFFDNPTETLFQGEGNVRLANNLFLNAHGDAIALQPHHDFPRRVSIDHNFVAASGRGITIRDGGTNEERVVADNAVYAERPLEGGSQRSNIVGPFSKASQGLKRWLAQALQLRIDNGLDRPHLVSIERKACESTADKTDNRLPALQNKPAHPLCTFLRMIKDDTANVWQTTSHRGEHTNRP